MSNEALSAVAQSDIRPSGRKFVAMALADYADEEWSCFPSVEQLARYTCQGEKTVRDHLAALEADGIVTRLRHRRDDGTLGRYRFKLHRRNLPLAPRETTGENHPVANFARGEKQPSPPANFAAHNPQEEPSSISSSARGEFDEFWSAYPHKVGKRAAETAFARARKRVSQTELMFGLMAYVSKTDDRPWCNPATWLNQDRWADLPAAIRPRGSPQRPARGADLFLQAAEYFDNAAGPVRERDEGHRHDAPGLPQRAIGYHR